MLTPTHIPSLVVLVGWLLQHFVGLVFGLRSAVAVPFQWSTSPKPSADLCVSRNGGRSLRNYLFRSRSRSRARVFVGSGGTHWKGSRTHRPGSIDLEWSMARKDDRIVSDERSDLADTVFCVPG